MIKNYYLQLRSKYCHSEVLFPLSVRSFESIIRLCQARAKLSCRNVVEPADVEEVKDMYNQLLLQCIASEKEDEAKRRNAVDRTDISNLSIPKQVKVFLEVLNEECNIKRDRVFTLAELREIAKSMRMRVGEFYQFIDKLNHDGHFLKKGNDLYYLLTNLDL